MQRERMSIPTPLVILFGTHFAPHRLNHESPVVAKGSPVDFLRRMQEVIQPHTLAMLNRTAQAQLRQHFFHKLPSTITPTPNPTKQLLLFCQNSCSAPGCSVCVLNYSDGTHLPSTNILTDAKTSQKWSQDNWPWYWPWSCDRHIHMMGEQWSALEKAYGESWFEGDKDPKEMLLPQGTPAFEAQVLRMTYRFVNWMLLRFCQRDTGEPLDFSHAVKLCLPLSDEKYPREAAILAFGCSVFADLAQSRNVVDSSAILLSVSWIMWITMQAIEDDVAFQSFEYYKNMDWSVRVPRSLLHNLVRDCQDKFCEGAVILSRFCHLKLMVGITPPQLIPTVFQAQPTTTQQNSPFVSGQHTLPSRILNDEHYHHHRHHQQQHRQQQHHTNSQAEWSVEVPTHVPQDIGRLTYEGCDSLYPYAQHEQSEQDGQLQQQMHSEPRHVQHSRDGQLLHQPQQQQQQQQQKQRQKRRYKQRQQQQQRQ